MQDKVVVITGAAHGIGRATAAVFSAEGAIVVLADVEHAAAQEAAREMAAKGGKACAVECDVSQGQSVLRMVQLVVEQFGRIDVLHANAAVQINKEAIEITEDEWDKLHGVNLRGVFLCCKHVIPVMRRQKQGTIIITSSGHAFATYPNCSAYAATKGGELAYMRGLALDYAPHGIRVNCVIPGATDTRLVQRYINDSENPGETRRRLLDRSLSAAWPRPRKLAVPSCFWPPITPATSQEPAWRWMADCWRRHSGEAYRIEGSCPGPPTGMNLGTRLSAGGNCGNGPCGSV